jgi:hypothetical protein
MLTYKDAFHETVRVNILNGNLSTIPLRLYFDQNINLFLPVNGYPNQRNAKVTLNRIYIKFYRCLILDFRFEFRVKINDNIGVFATEDIDSVGQEIFVGAFSRQISKADSNTHPSCVVRQLNQVSSNNSHSRLLQHWVLVGSIALLNHAHNHCSQLKPFDMSAINESAHLYSSFRVITQIRSITKGIEICISYTDNDSDIFYICTICN